MTAYQVVLLLVVALSAVSCRPTHCERWRGDNEFRCGKDNYHADSIHIRNIANQNVSFKVSKWLSKCGRGGTKYVDGEHWLSPGGSMNVDFGEVGHGACNEMYIYSCKINGNNANCLDAVYPTPNH